MYPSFSEAFKLVARLETKLVLVTQSSKRVTFSASHVKSTITRVDVEVEDGPEEPRCAAIPRELMTNALGEDRDDYVVEVHDDDVTVRWTTGSCLIRGVSAESTDALVLPLTREQWTAGQRLRGGCPLRLSTPDESRFVPLDQVLLQLVDTVSYASDPGRGPFGIRVEHADGRLTVVATNGWRLACASSPTSIPYPAAMTFSPNVRNVVARAREFCEWETDTGSWLALAEPSCLTQTKLITQYSDWSRVVPPTTNPVRVSRGDLLATVTRSSRLAGVSGIHFSFDDVRNAITTWVASDTGNAEDMVPGARAGVEVAMNHAVCLDPNYVRECLENLTGDHVLVTFGEKLHPVKISDEDGGRFGVVMAMKP